MDALRNGILHQYTPQLTAFEHVPDASASRNNLVIFIGGLFDGLGTVPYTDIIAKRLASSWSIVEIVLTSSYTGWGISSLKNDVREISKCVEYFHRIKSGLIVLLGHSTGCQDIMEYLTGEGRQTRSMVNGCIMQAPASDREYLVTKLNPQIYRQSCLEAQQLVNSGRDKQILAYREEIYRLLPCPISAKRWLSLASPNKDGDDDYFSSDLTTEQLMKSFGMIPGNTPICILISGSDQYMPTSIDKAALLYRWSSIIAEGEGKYDPVHSGIVQSASHSLCNDSDYVVDDLVRRVLGFLYTLCPHT